MFVVTRGDGGTTRHTRDYIWGKAAQKSVSAELGRDYLAGRREKASDSTTSAEVGSATCM